LATASAPQIGSPSAQASVACDVRHVLHKQASVAGAPRSRTQDDSNACTLWPPFRNCVTGRATG